LVCFLIVLHEAMDEASQSYGRFSGTMAGATGGSGRIKDDFGNEVLVMLADCIGYGGQLPHVGARVSYDLIVDATLATLKAENVQPEDTHPSVCPLVACEPQLQSTDNVSSLALSTMTNTAPQLAIGLVPESVHRVRSFSEDRRSGVFHKEKGSFGFIQQDSGEAEMFVMPRQCTAYGGAFPPLGTRVVFEVVPDSKTGKPRAENVRPGFSGTMSKIKGNYGFIAQDSGEPEMFVMPRQCAYFGETLPSIGTRVVYEVVADSKTGKPRAEDVRPMLKQSGQLNQQASFLALQDGLPTDHNQLEGSNGAVAPNGGTPFNIMALGSKRQRLLGN